jgi:signal transduction histidine kinase
MSPWRGAPLGAEACLVVLASVGTFAVSAVLLATPLSHTPVVILGIGYFLVVLAANHFWRIAYAIPVGVASAVALDWYRIPPTHSSIVPDGANSLALSVYLGTGILLGQLAAHARRRADGAELALSALAQEQAALRRVATLVARESTPATVFAVVAEEVGRLLRTDLTVILRYETDSTASVVAAWSPSAIHLPVGMRLELDGESAAGVLPTERTAQMDNVGSPTGSVVELFRGVGVHSAASSWIVVDESAWGVMVTASAQSESLSRGTESRIAEFTQLVATAISTAETRAELTASRARIVASCDETRRRLERDLHDGAQQRLVSLGLELRAALEMASEEPPELQTRLTRIGVGLTGVFDDLREISHGIHPAILSEGGLRPALEALARRSAVPVEIEVRGDHRLEAQIEVAAYYVVSEALTNAAKHAQATVVRVHVETEDVMARLSIRDDGVGGADMGNGSGLVGLQDRVEALNGRMKITSRPGSGTSLQVMLPIQKDSAVPAV